MSGKTDERPASSVSRMVQKGATSDDAHATPSGDRFAAETLRHKLSR